MKYKKTKLSRTELVEKANLKSKLVNVAYKVKGALEDAKAKFLENNANWKVLTESHSDPDSQLSQFKAVAFVNEATREVVIAHAGTRLSLDDLGQSLQDVWADGQLAAKITPDLKFQSIRPFVTGIQSLLPNGGEGYKFLVTGHSLGAVLSDLTAAELVSRGLKVISSITFDNPGSLPIIEHALRNGLFTDNNMSVNSLREQVDFVAIQAESPNVVSRTNPQMGDRYIKVQAPSVISGDEIVSTQDSGASYVSYLFSKVGNVARQMSSFLNLENITASYKLISDFYNPQKFDEMVRNVQTVKDGFIKKINDELWRPVEVVKDDVIGIVGCLAKIGLGVGAIYGGNYFCGAMPIVQGAVGLGLNLKKLPGDVQTAYNKLAIFAKSLTVVGGHSLPNFDNITEGNLLEVQSGDGIEGSQLVVSANTSNPQALSKLRELEKTKTEEAKKVKDSEKAEKSSLSYCASSIDSLKEAVISHTTQLTGSVKVALPNGESVILSYAELREFCAGFGSSEFGSDDRIDVAGDASSWAASHEVAVSA